MNEEQIARSNLRKKIYDLANKELDSAFKNNDSAMVAAIAELIKSVKPN